MDFVGVDGEGVTVHLDDESPCSKEICGPVCDRPNEHRYVLFGCGDKQIQDHRGLSYTAVFDFLYSQRRNRTAYVGFFLGYDFTQIFKTLPEDKAWILLTTEGRALRKHRIPGQAPHPVQCGGWQFDILGMKRLRIRPKDCDCEIATCGCKFRPWMYVCDVGAFFQTSFLNVINPKDWPEGTCPVTEEEYAEIDRGKSRRSTAILDAEMRRYNALENSILARVMGTLDKGFLDIGVHLPASKWFGPGQAAQTWLTNEGVPTGEEIRKVVPPWFMEAARMSYFGGWFEIFMHGHVSGETHEYDINSAYPSIIRNLPCLLHGTFSRGNGIPQCPDTDYTLVYAEVQSPGIPRSQPAIGTMLHRDTTGRILRPSGTAGWYWLSELRAAEKAGLVKRLSSKAVLRWVSYHPCDCPPPMAGISSLYEKRLQAGKKSPMGKAAKLVYNSAYGKFAQSIGDPIFGNPVYASFITAGCRTIILKAIGTHPKGIKDVAMVATDAVFFCNSHPGLSVSDRLGEWDYKARSNLTLFKPGVYWDDSARRQIAKGESPAFKARGFNARDFASRIRRVDAQFDTLRDHATSGTLGRSDWQWPRVTFIPTFSMTTALQAIRQGSWNHAGRVSNAVELTQDSNPSDKRIGLFSEVYDGRTILRTKPHFGMVSSDDGATIQLRPIPSNPYEKRFGMEDPFSEEYREQFGVTEDGAITNILAWIIKGE